MAGKIWKFTYNPKTNVSVNFFEACLINLNGQTINFQEYLLNGVSTSDSNTIIHTIKSGNIIKGCIIKDLSQHNFLTRDRTSNEIRMTVINNRTSVSLFVFNLSNNRGAFTQQEGSIKFWEFNKLLKTSMIISGQQITRKNVILASFEKEDALTYVRHHMDSIECTFFQHDADTTLENLSICSDRDIQFVELLKCKFVGEDINTFLNELNNCGKLGSVLKFTGKTDVGRNKTVNRDKMISNAFPEFNVDDYNKNVERLIAGQALTNYVNLDLFTRLITYSS